MCANKHKEFIARTNRLVLRQFQISDAEHLYLLNSDPEVIRYTGDSPFESILSAEDFLRNYSHYQTYGYGRWACVRKNEGDFVGWCGLKYNEKNMVDLGFRFFKKYWNQGFATEAAIECLKYGFDHLGIDEIIGRVAQKNQASVRVLEKIGMKFWKKEECMGIQDSSYYSINKSEFNVDIRERSGKFKENDSYKKLHVE